MKISLFVTFISESVVRKEKKEMYIFLKNLIR